LKEARTVREARDLEVANALAAKLAAVKLTFAVKTGEGGKMFGAISTAEIAAKLAEHGIELERKRIHLGQGPVKLLGKHVSTIRLHANVTVEQEFEVISENPIEEIKEEAEESDRPERDKKPRKEPRKERSEKSDKPSKAKAKK
jgi:large subunit ribosomal protein L9